MAETVPGYEAVTWVSVFAPAKTPRAIVDQLNAALGKVLRDPAVAPRLSTLTYDAVHASPEELARRVKADYANIGKVFRQFGVSVE